MELVQLLGEMSIFQPKEKFITNSIWVGFTPNSTRPFLSPFQAHSHQECQEGVSKEVLVVHGKKNSTKIINFGLQSKSSFLVSMSCFQHILLWISTTCNPINRAYEPRNKAFLFPFSLSLSLCSLQNTFCFLVRLSPSKQISIQLDMCVILGNVQKSFFWWNCESYQAPTKV